MDLDAAQDEINSAKVALSREGNSFDADIRLQEKILYETFDPRIDEGIEFFQAKLDWLRSPGRISSRVLNVERNLITDTKTVTGESNADALLEAILYCQSSIKILEGLKLSPECHIEEIQELKDGIPSIDLYTKPLKGEKPLPGSKGINPLHLLPSDSELDWKFGKLMQKFKKVMGG